LDDGYESGGAEHRNEIVGGVMRGREEGGDGGWFSRRWKKLEMSKGTGSMTWKPQIGRRQSWNHEDLKRELQMSTVVEKEAKQVVGSGFSEKRV
jgi:hypothetical protein